MLYKKYEAIDSITSMMSVLFSVVVFSVEDVPSGEAHGTCPVQYIIRNGVLIMSMEFARKACGVLGVCLKYYCLVGAVVFITSFGVTVVTLLNV